MSKINFSTIDEYISTFHKDVQKVLKNIRKTIKEAVPGVEETISYQIPTFKLDGKYLIYFAGWKNHVSLYPKPRNNEALTRQLSVYKGGKGTVQFPLDKPIPLSLIKKIAKYRIKKSLEKQKRKNNKE